jgi:Toprim domain
MRVEGMTTAEAVSTIREWPDAPASLPPSGGGDAEKLAFIKAIWTSAGPLSGSIAERYLDETRHIDVTRLPEDIHRSLRFHPNCIFGSTHLPCLIALMRDPLSDEPVGIQRIALRERDGHVEKAGRRMLGRAGVVKLWPAGSQLVIGEGLETVLAAATRIPYADAPLTPAWATLTSEKLGRLPPIPGVSRLIILVDHDAAGLMASGACTARWTGAGRTVVALTPEPKGADFNDLLAMAG